MSTPEVRRRPRLRVGRVLRTTALQGLMAATVLGLAIFLGRPRS